jgi:Ca2+-binding RTX toxin-like protein
VIYLDNDTPGHADDSVTFHDSAVELKTVDGSYTYPPAQTQCVEADVHTVVCQADNVTEVRLYLGDGDDAVSIAGDPIDVFVDGSVGSETVFGGSGDDDVDAGPQNDVILGGAGNDTLGGSSGSDRLVGGTGADDLAGASGEDTVDYRDSSAPVKVDMDGAADDGAAGENDNVTGFEIIHGGTAGDDLNGFSGAEIIYGHGGEDELAGLGGDDVLFGGAARDKLSGGSGLDDVRGDEGDDALYGGIHDDTLLGGIGSDYHSGGLGNDSAQYWERSAKVVADIDGETGDDGEAGEGDTITGTVEGIMGGSGPDELTGSDGANGLYGREGEDVLTGGLGPDRLDGGAGADTLRSNDGVVDTDRCGSEADSVDADAEDAVDADCESVTRPAPVPAPGGGDDGGGGDVGGGGGQVGDGVQGEAGGPAMGIAKKARLAGAKARIRLSCPASAAGTCSGSLALGPAGKAGRKAFAITSGERAKIKVKVAKKVARKAVRKGSAKVRATAMASDDSGSSATSRARISLRGRAR